MRTRIIKRENWTCQKCGKKPDHNVKVDAPRSCYSYIADHIIPIALSGVEFEETNLQLLCGECNAEKTKADQAKIAKKRSEIRLLRNPFAIQIKPIFLNRPPGVMLTDFPSI